LMIAGWIRRRHRAEKILRVAEAMLDTGSTELDDETLARLVKDKVLLASQADVVALIAPATMGTSEEPVIINKGVLRVAANHSGEPVNARNRLTDGRLAVARMIGYGPQARHAHLALMELSAEVCWSNRPDCGVCPLSGSCAFAAKRAESIDLCDEPLAQDPREADDDGFVPSALVV
jgi:DNA (cytosine-5)-methyltransferase 1